MSDGGYICTITANGYVTASKEIYVSAALESKEVDVEMTSLDNWTEPVVQISFVDEDGAEVYPTETVTDGLLIGTEYTVPQAYLTTQRVSIGESEKKNIYKYDSEKSVVTIDELQEGLNELSVVYIKVDGEYYFYEDFEDHSEGRQEAGWNAQTVYPEIIKEAGNKIIKETSSGSTVGAYTTFEEISGNSNKFVVKADLRLTNTTTGGNTQFTVGGKTPKFSRDYIDWGYISGSAGHIIALEYITASDTLTINGKSMSSDFIGGWVYMYAVVDFGTKKVEVTLTDKNNEAITETINADFYSGSNGTDAFGSYYLRAPSPNGSLSVDNIFITAYMG